MTEVAPEIIERNIRITLAKLKVILARDKYVISIFKQVAAQRRADDLRAGGEEQ